MMEPGPQFEKTLPMFMTPREIKSGYRPTPGDAEDHETDDQLWERKAKEAKETEPWGSQFHVRPGEESLHDNIGRKGVMNPVGLELRKPYQHYYGPSVVGGNHRVASAFEHAPDDLIPVQHYNNISEARDAKGALY